MFQIKPQRGFTLIELLVVTSIIALITAVSAASFSNYNRTQTLSQATQNLESALKEAQNRVLSSVEGKNWGVHIVPNTNTLELFSSSSTSYSDASTATFPRDVASGVEFFDPTGQLPAGTNANITFSLPDAAVGFLSDSGSCVGGSDDFDCSPDLGVDCLTIGVRLQGESQARYLKINQRSIFEDDDGSTCP